MNPTGADMNYSQSLSFLNTFIDLEKLSQFPKNPFFNLKRMDYLLRLAGHPERKFLPILIAGTTGKGSTGFFLESILRANKIPVGYYHSPHVMDPRERIRLQGKMIPKKLWAEGLSEIRGKLRAKPMPSALGSLTYFEVMTFLAILVFLKKGIRVGIFEIGLGGRLDATNILKAPLVILTPIHLDHEAFLGNTVRKIAKEKAAIIKSKNHVVIARQFPQALDEIRVAVREKKANLWRSQPVSKSLIRLSGSFQRENAGTALKAAEILREYFSLPIRKELVRQGLKLQNWAGRMESAPRFAREFILDGAHNPLSVRRLVSEIKKQGKNKDLWLVFGAMRDKNSLKMLDLLSRHFRKILLVPIRNVRAKSLGMLLKEANGLFDVLVPVQNFGEAMVFLRKNTLPGSRIVVTGSFYLVGEAKKALKNG